MCLTRLMDGEMLGTLFITDNDRITAHQQWLAAHLQTAGRLVLDDGAVKAIKDNHRKFTSSWRESCGRAF